MMKYALLLTVLLGTGIGFAAVDTNKETGPAVLVVSGPEGWFSVPVQVAVGDSQEQESEHVNWLVFRSGPNGGGGSAEDQEFALNNITESDRVTLLTSDSYSLVKFVIHPGNDWYRKFLHECGGQGSDCIAFGGGGGVTTKDKDIIINFPDIRTIRP